MRLHFFIIQKKDIYNYLQFCEDNVWIFIDPMSLAEVIVHTPEEKKNKKPFTV